MIMVLVTVMSVVMVVVTMTTLMVMVVVLVVVEKCKDSIDSIVFTPTDNQAIKMYGLL